MRTVRLGESDLEVAPLGVGCWSWGDRRYWRYGEEHGAREVVDAFGACLDAGLALFDTAESYGWGEGEKILGWLARKSGRDLVLATKFAPLTGRGGASAIAKGLAGSLKRLGVPRVALYQLHWADIEEAPIAAWMDALADAHDQGLVRAVGVSNFRASELREAHAALARRGVPLATCQVRWSLLHRAPEADGVLDACRELGVTLLAYSPLEQGILAGTYGPGRLPPDLRAEAPWFAAENLAAAAPLVASLRAMGEARGVGPGAIALAWLLARGAVPLAGARDGAQAAANARALGVTLEADEIAALEASTERWRIAR